MRRLKISPEFPIVLAAFVVITFTCVVAFAEPPTHYPGVKILNVKDGDTVEVMAEVWPDTFVKTDVRVFGIDTPETRRGVKNGKRIPECELILGQIAKKFAFDMLMYETGPIALINVDPKSTKYAGRISGDFMFWRGEEMVIFSEAMISGGHAVSYSGGTRDVWPCEEEK